jgi:AbrB family looped-hinge helix DNA binding protein
MIVTLKPKTEITVPKSIRRRAGMKAGDQFEFSVRARVIAILPKRIADDEYTPAQRRTVDRAIAKGLDNIKHGRLEGPFSKPQGIYRLT